ncbi:transcription factor FER-like iron deficiency-induced transcription factor-like protein [Tanacetum coccineum]
MQCGCNHFFLSICMQICQYGDHGHIVSISTEDLVLTHHARITYPTFRRDAKQPNHVKTQTIYTPMRERERCNRSEIYMHDLVIVGFTNSKGRSGERDTYEGAIYRTEVCTEVCAGVIYPNKVVSEPGYDKQRQKTSWSSTVTAVSEDRYRGRGYDKGQEAEQKQNQCSKLVASKDKEVNKAARDSDDALVCCIENTVEDRIMVSGASFHASYCTKELERLEQYHCLGEDYSQFNYVSSGYLLFPELYGHNEANDGTGNGIGCYEVMDPNLNVIWNQEEDDVKVSGDDDSSETGTTCNPDTQRRRGGSVKGDRTRTLISERKRRSGMKEKLYALRALVPDITKMDKASIVGDAARYIHDLQTQARNLRSEIATIEATKHQKMSSQNSIETHHLSNSLPILKKILKMDIFVVEETGYYVKLICNKGRGVAVALHKALESITSFQVQSSNLATVGDNFVLTFTLNVSSALYHYKNIYLQNYF